MTPEVLIGGFVLFVAALGLIMGMNAGKNETDATGRAPR